jgi:hypothetical protein
MRESEGKQIHRKNSMWKETQRCKSPSMEAITISHVPPASEEKVYII